MDVETAEAITTLRADIRHVEINLRADIRRVEMTLSDRIDTLSRQVDGLGGQVDGLGGRVDSLGGQVDSLGGRVDSLGGKVDSLDGRLDATASSLRDEMRQIGQESKRHSEVLFESLRDDIRIVAEGLVSLGAKVELLLPPDRRP
jgi:chromosome segregation ATPase